MKRMKILEIEEWKEDRLKYEGKWREDVLDQTFKEMEKYGPETGLWRKDLKVPWPYVRLLEISCEYVRDCGSLVGLQLLLSRCERSIEFLDLSDKRQFFEQLAWMLHVPEFAEIVAQCIFKYGGRMPDATRITFRWMHARREYKRRR